MQLYQRDSVPRALYEDCREGGGSFFTELLLPLRGGDSMLENEANTGKSRAKKRREPMS